VTGFHPPPRYHVSASFFILVEAFYEGGKGRGGFFFPPFYGGGGGAPPPLILNFFLYPPCGQRCGHCSRLDSGYPKRLGQVLSRTRYDAATGQGSPALAPGANFAGSL